MALQIDEHPTVLDFWQKAARMPPDPVNSAPREAAGTRQLCFDAGSDDVGFVEVERAEFGSHRAKVSALRPGTRTLTVLEAWGQPLNNQNLLAQS